MSRNERKLFKINGLQLAGGMALPSYLNPLGVPLTGEKAFVQPVLAANGTLGGSSFAVAGSS